MADAKKPRESITTRIDAKAREAIERAAAARRTTTAQVAGSCSRTRPSSSPSSRRRRDHIGKLLDIKSRQTEPRTDLAAEVAPKLEAAGLSVAELEHPQGARRGPSSWTRASGFYTSSEITGLTPYHRTTSVRASNRTRGMWSVAVTGSSGFRPDGPCGYDAAHWSDKD
jgi:hypothetical protein